MLSRRTLGKTALLSGAGLVAGKPASAQMAARGGSTHLEYEMLSDLMASPAMRAVFSEQAMIDSWVKTWAAMAMAQAQHGIVPTSSAAEINRILGSLRISPGELVEDTRKVGRGIAPALRRVRAAVGKDLASHVHVGSTTQDIMDTGLALQMKDGLALIEQDTSKLMRALIDMAQAHKGTVMAGRTNGLQAAPITFGLKAAGWLSEVTRGVERLTQAKPRALAVQLGGPVGTFEVMGPQGPAARETMAQNLGLSVHPAGWYTGRDNIAELLFSIGLLVSALGHVAIETGILVRTEIDEVREGGGPGRGASSALPQKSNPRSTEFLEGLSRLIQSRAAGLYTILWQPNERHGGAWIAEWPLVPEHFLIASGALKHANDLIGGLAINEKRMLANLNLDGGAVLSEAFAGALAPAFGRPQAYDLVKAAVAKARASGKTLAEELSATPEVASSISSAELHKILDPRQHVGQSDALVDAVCEQAERALRA